MSNNIYTFKYKIYNPTLDPTLWDKAGNLNVDISNRLLKIAYDFYEGSELRIPLHDVYLVGSSASYNYTPGSDIDVHLVIDYRDLNMPEEMAKKFVSNLKSKWNISHDIHVKNKNVEIGVQDLQNIHSAGIFSILNRCWIKKPEKGEIIINKDLINQKYSDMVIRIDDAIKTQDMTKIKQIITDLYAMRQTGLDNSGEYSTENLVFKILRNKGYLDKLKELKNVIYDKEMSLAEMIKIDNKIQLKEDKIDELYDKSSSFIEIYNKL